MGILGGLIGSNWDMMVFFLGSNGNLRWFFLGSNGNLFMDIWLVVSTYLPL